MQRIPRTTMMPCRGELVRTTDVLLIMTHHRRHGYKESQSKANRGSAAKGGTGSQAVMSCETLGFPSQITMV